MKYVVTWTFRSFGSAAEQEASVTRLLKVSLKVDATRERDVPRIPWQDRWQRRLPSGRDRQPSGSSRNYSQVHSVRRFSGGTRPGYRRRSGGGASGHRVQGVDQLKPANAGP